MKKIFITQRFDEIGKFSERRNNLDVRFLKIFEKLKMIPIFIPNNIFLTKKMIKDIKINGIILSSGGDALKKDVRYYTELLLIDFAYKNKQSPLFELGLSFIIMVLFIMYSKIHYILNIVIFILLGIIYFMNDIIIYYNENQNDSNRTIYSKYALLYTVKDSLIMLCVLLLIIGYSMYLSS